MSLIFHYLIRVHIHAWRVQGVRTKDQIRVAVDWAIFKGLRKELAVRKEAPVFCRASIYLTPPRIRYATVRANTNVAFDRVFPRQVRASPWARLGVVNVAPSIFNISLDGVVPERYMLRTGNARRRTKAIAPAAGTQFVGAAITV